eukprot:TRINITY_DN2360_c0_g1_i3.p1 TRINITY_DN2360_c0_g1~~TRINITY_DN2360_c0_g1_i3.p1  ORF type:complete len:166 (+),score=63.50 TRINITY_DN2360_c0_g1_i3:39-536(+)
MSAAEDESCSVSGTTGSGSGSGSDSSSDEQQHQAASVVDFLCPPTEGAEAAAAQQQQQQQQQGKRRGMTQMLKDEESSTRVLSDCMQTAKAHMHCLQVFLSDSAASGDASKLRELKHLNDEGVRTVVARLFAQAEALNEWEEDERQRAFAVFPGDLSKITKLAFV